MTNKPFKTARKQFTQDMQIGFRGFNYRDKITENYFIYDMDKNEFIFTSDYELYLDNKCVGVTRTVTELDQLAKDFI